MYDVLEDYLVYRDRDEYRKYDAPAGELLDITEVFPQKVVDYILEEYPTAAFAYHDYFKEIDNTVVFLLDNDHNKLFVHIMDEDSITVSEYSDVPNIHTDLLELWKKHVDIS